MDALKNFPDAYSTKLEDVFDDPDSKWENRLINSQNRNECIYFFAEINEKIIGMIGAYWVDYFDIPELIGLYVQKEFQNQGVGKLLVEKCSKELGELGFKREKIGVHRSNFSVFQYYKKLDFVELEQSEEEIFLIKNIDFN